MNQAINKAEDKSESHARDNRQERSLSRGIFILLIIASVLLIGQSLYNLSNLDAVDDSIVTVHQAADRLEQFERKIITPIAGIRMLSMEMVLAPNKTLVSEIELQLDVRIDELEEELENWEAVFQDDNFRLVTRDEYESVVIAWEKYRNSLQRTRFYIEKSVRIAAFISVSQQEKASYESLQQVLRAFGTTQMLKSTEVYNTAQASSRVAYYTLIITAIIQIVILIAILFFVERMIRSYIRSSKVYEKELAMSRDTAEAATRAKSDFLANMSHEIRTPMNAVIGLSNLALDTELTTKQRDYLTKIEGSGKALLGIINDILDFSKIEAGKLEMEQAPFDLHIDVLENVSNVIGLKAVEKGLEIVFDFDTNVPAALVGDPLRLGQVLINLFNNAIKFTEHGEIKLIISVLEQTDQSTMLRLAIKDTGIGMTEEQVGRLFQAFSQADISTTRKFGGTGLGLTISKRLVEMMDGEIGVESEPGQGSTFWFTARFGRANEHELTKRAELDVDLQGLKVLVVDDNPSSRVILSRYLESFEYQVDVAEDGVEAIEILEAAPKESQFDLVVMDWKMPNMDGLEVTRRIKADKNLVSIPSVMMVTAYDREQLEAEAQEVELDGILVKPVSQSTLLDGILMAFGKGSVVRDRRSAQGLPMHCFGARLLLVEDNEINQQVAREILEKAGCEVTLVVNGLEAVDAVKARPDYFDGVLMDIQMPVLDGYGATRAIRKDGRSADLPIIAMTANAFASDREAALESGMNDHVAKPIEVSELFNVIAAHVAVPEHRRSRLQIADDESAQVDRVDQISIEGIDSKAAIARCAGNVQLYRELLAKFSAAQADAAARLQQLLSDGDYVQLEIDAHTIKGVAANLGISQLSKEAEVLELALKTGGEVAPIIVECLLQELELMLGRINAATASDEALNSNATAAVDDLPVAELLAQLVSLLEDFDVDAGKVMPRIKARIDDDSVIKTIEKIEALLGEYDFEGALALAVEIDTESM